MKMTAQLVLAAAATAVLSGSATAADIYMPPASSAFVAQAPAATDWDGAYIGASLGYGWGTASDTTAPDTAGPQGWTLGGQVGYNFHLGDNVVTGLEGDLNWSGEAGAYAGAPGTSFRKNWDGSVRGRLGVDLDGILPYAEAGIAFVNATQAPGGSATYTGWTAGAGLEFKLADQVSTNVEYRYSDYGTQTLGADTVDLHDNTVKVGLNYHF